MEADESMGEDARSIAYFDMYVFPSTFPFGPCISRGLIGAKLIMQGSATGGRKRPVCVTTTGDAVG
jgi:hypothetical protein